MIGDLYPRRFACFDIGSNAVRFVIAEFSSSNEYVLLYRKREPIRLATSPDKTAPLPEVLMEQVKRFFLDQIPYLSSFHVDDYRAVATSAVRESKNGKAFCDWITQETACKLEIISEEEEARLVYEAVDQRLDLHDHDWLMLDIGGGSVQISLIHHTAFKWSKSCPIGAVRLWESFKQDLPDISKLESHIVSSLQSMNIPTSIEQRNHSAGIATGGSLEEIARLSKLTRNSQCNPVVTLTQIKEIKNKLLSCSIQDRIHVLGINEDRADIIVPAVVLVEQFCCVQKLSSLILPFISLRDGILLRLAKQNPQSF